MNEIEKNHIERFVENPEFVDAVKKAVLEQILTPMEILLKDKTNYPSEELGNEIKTYIKARNMVEQCFSNIYKYKKVGPTEQLKNKAI